VLGKKDSDIFEKLRHFDALVIAGEAKSHCVAWTVEDLLNELRAQDESLAGKIYLLEDCTTPVVAPGIVDYTEQADAAFERFEQAGMHRVLSTDPIETWPGIR
jgi:nicotinamidase-related amidase